MLLLSPISYFLLFPPPNSSSCIIPGNLLEMPKMTSGYASYINEQLSRLLYFLKNSWTGQGNKLYVNTEANKTLTASQDRSVKSSLSPSNLISLVDRLMGLVQKKKTKQKQTSHLCFSAGFCTVGRYILVNKVQRVVQMTLLWYSRFQVEWFKRVILESSYYQVTVLPERCAEHHCARACPRFAAVQYFH